MSSFARLLEHGSCRGGIVAAVEVPEPLLHAIGDRHLGVRIAEREQGREPLGSFLIELLLAEQQDAPGAIEGVIAPAAMAGLLGLDPAPHAVEAAIGERDDVEGIDDLRGLRQDHGVDGGIGGGHVERPEADPLFPGLWLLVQEGGDLLESPGGQDVDDLVVLDVGDRRRVAAVAMAGGTDEVRLIEADGARVVEALAVGREQRPAIGGDGVVHRVPVTGELARHLLHRPSPADLDRRPLGGARREQAVLGGDAVVLEDEGADRTGHSAAAHPVFLPRQAHRGAIDREVDIGDDGPLFDLGPCPAARA
jgi:hypothetical protein